MDDFLARGSYRCECEITRGNEHARGRGRDEQRGELDGDANMPSAGRSGGPSDLVAEEDQLRHHPARHLLLGNHREYFEPGRPNQAQYARDRLHLHER